MAGDALRMQPELLDRLVADAADALQGVLVAHLADGVSVQFAAFLAAREQVLPWIKEYSPYEHVSADDPPVYMFYSSAPALGQEQKDPTHTANFGVKLEEKLKSVGVECELVYPTAPGIKHVSTHAYLLEKLKAPAKKA